MRAISLFSGIGGFDLALRNCGHEVVGHSEIDVYAEKVYSNHFDNPNLGDVSKIEDLPDFDILVGGSPCQDLSVANTNRKGLEGDRSSLFWEYVRILKKFKPKYFILENVASMKGDTKGQQSMSFFEDKNDAEIITDTLITDTLGVVPIMIDSARFTAQRRRKLFWTNIPVKECTIDKGILLKDILERVVDKKYYISIKGIEYMNRETKGGRSHWDFGYHNESDQKKARQLQPTLEKVYPTIF